MVMAMTHFDLVSGGEVELRPHSDVPWERWKVCDLLPHVAELERSMSVEWAIECVGTRAVYGAIVAAGKDPEFEDTVTFHLLAVRLPDGRLTDELGHNIEMREVAS